MTFSSKVKTEICSRNLESDCCIFAMCYGMLLFGKTFSSTSISILSELECVVDTYIDLIFKTTGFKAEKIVTEKGKFKVSIENPKHINHIQKVFSCDDSSAMRTRINRGNLQNLRSTNEDFENCCDRAFLSGAFLACGSVTNPNSGYHFEFSTPKMQLSTDLSKILSDNGIPSKIINRRNIYVVYIKESLKIEDLLNMIGAPYSQIDLMEVKIEKSLVNKVNRESNLEFANVLKVGKASAERMQMINAIKNSDEFDKLSDDLKEFIALREQNLDLSLSAFGALYNPPITKSAVNYKLKRLNLIYKKLGKTE